MGESMKGQGSTEYLVIFAAVLVVALLVIFLLGNFSGFGTKSLVDQSKGYWSGQVPLGIVAYSPVGTNNLTMSIQNKDVKKIELRAVSLDGTANSAGLPKNITAGNTADVNVNFTSTVCAAADSGQLKEFQMVLTYGYPPSTVNYTIVGTTPLRVVCP
ncbi:MAG: class III signal peptide-containing protein [Candidatus Anstonellales archaeon]